MLMKSNLQSIFDYEESPTSVSSSDNFINDVKGLSTKVFSFPRYLVKCKEFDPDEKEGKKIVNLKDVRRILYDKTPLDQKEEEGNCDDKKCRNKSIEDVIKQFIVDYDMNRKNCKIGVVPEFNIKSHEIKHNKHTKRHLKSKIYYDYFEDDDKENKRNSNHIEECMNESNQNIDDLAETNTTSNDDNKDWKEYKVEIMLKGKTFSGNRYSKIESNFLKEVSDMNLRITSSIDRKYQTDLEKLESDGRTTCMIKNIPNKYTQQMLLDMPNEHHFECFDFVYLRIDFKSQCNVGYAFINFTDTAYVATFYLKVHNKGWKKFYSNKIAELTYASIQGLDNLKKKFKRSSVMQEKESYRPKIFHSTGSFKGLEQPLF